MSIKVPVLPYVADGFHKDVETILTEFQEMRTFKFSDFAEIWRKMNFAYIYIGQESEKELREFTQECFFIVLSYIVGEKKINFRVGALYLLYSMYFKQSMDTFYKIRIQSKHWEELMNIYHFGQRRNHPSICFVVVKLLSVNAFRSVALPKLMGPSVTVNTETSKLDSTNIENKKLVFKEFSEQNLQKLDFMAQKYDEAKAMLKHPRVVELNALGPNKYKDMIEFLKTSVADGRETMPPSSLTSRKGRQEPVNDIGDRRFALKSKQFGKSSTAISTQRCKELLKQSSSQLCEGSNVDDPLSAERCGSTSQPDGAEDGIVIVQPEELNLKLKKKLRLKEPKGNRRRGRPRKCDYLDPAYFEEKESFYEEIEIEQPEINVLNGVPLPSLSGRKVEYRHRSAKPRKSKHHFASDSEDEDLLEVESVLT